MIQENLINVLVRSEETDERPHCLCDEGKVTVTVTIPEQFQILLSGSQSGGVPVAPTFFSVEPEPMFFLPSQFLPVHTKSVRE